MAAVTFKARFGALWFGSALLIKMIDHINVSEILGHANDIFVANQTCLLVLSHIKIDFGKEVAVPLFGRRDWRTGRLICLTGLVNMLNARPMTMNAADGFVHRISTFFFHVLMTLMTHGIGDQDAGLCRDLLQRGGTVRSITPRRISISFGYHLAANHHRPRPADYQQQKQDPQMARIANEVHISLDPLLVCPVVKSG